MKEPALLEVGTAKGLNTYAALGSADQPVELRGAVLRPGGWACAPAAHTVRPSVQAAVWAGRGSELFLQTAAGIEYHNPDSPFPVSRVLPNTSTASNILPNAVTLGPGLAFSEVNNEGLYLHADFGVRPALYAATLTKWDGTGNAPTGPWYRVETTTGTLSAATETRLRLVPLRGPDAPAVSPYQGATEIVLPAVGPNARQRISFGNIAWGVNIYYDGQAAGLPPRTDPVFWQHNLDNVGGIRKDFFLEGMPAGIPWPTEATYLKAQAAEYHQGRVWATGAPRTYDATKNDPLIYDTRIANRLYYSEVVANFTGEALPFFASDYYFDVPFKVSSGIVAILSAGRYMYVFGDREVWVLNGYDDTSWTLESVGDSIGAISAASVQRLQSAVLYLSDSGLLLLSGGQATDVGGDVRDLLLALDRSRISSTVDHVLEQYLITDGTTTLVYHLREQGWTQRDPDGTNQQLVYGGGLPYSLHSQNLTVLNSPDLVPLTLTLGPFGSPRVRRLWRGLACSIDSDVGGTLSVTLSGRDVAQGQGLVNTVTDPATHAAGMGLTPVVLSLGKGGVGLSAGLARVTLILTPATGARRCMIRPAVEIAGTVQGETWAQ